MASTGVALPWADVPLDPAFAPPEKASAYRLDQIVTETLSIDEIRNIGETLHAARLPVGIGIQVATEIDSIGRQALTEAQREQMHRSTMIRLRQRLRRRHGRQDQRRQ